MEFRTLGGMVGRTFRLDGERDGEGGSGTVEQEEEDDNRLCKRNDEDDNRDGRTDVSVAPMGLCNTTVVDDDENGDNKGVEYLLRTARR